MAINTNHPKYEEYKKKVEQLQKEQKETADMIVYSKNSDEKLHHIFRTYADKLKELQQEYAYLFSEPIDK